MSARFFAGGDEPVTVFFHANQHVSIGQSFQTAPATEEPLSGTGCTAGWMLNRREDTRPGIQDPGPVCPFLPKGACLRMDRPSKNLILFRRTGHSKEPFMRLETVRMLESGFAGLDDLRDSLALSGEFHHPGAAVAGSGKIPDGQDAAVRGGGHGVPPR